MVDVLTLAYCHCLRFNGAFQPAGLVEKILDPLRAPALQPDHDQHPGFGLAVFLLQVLLAAASRPVDERFDLGYDGFIKQQSFT